MSNTTDITISFFNFLQFERRYSAHTITSYKNDISQFFSYLEQTYELTNPEEASYQIIRSWIITLVDQNLTARTVNRKIACLRSFFKFLIKKELIQKDPMIKIKAPKVKKTLPTFIEESHMHKLLDQLIYPEGFSGKRDKVILEMLYGTGIRLSELLNMKDTDIDRKSGVVKVLGKGNKERIIPLNKSLIELINVYIALKGEQMANRPGFFILTDKGEQAYPVFIYRIVKAYLSMITTLEKKSPHVLRHTFATHLLNKGADLNAIKDLLGHSSLAATQVYTHNTLDKIKAIFDQAHPKA